ncbi:MAG: menaquinol oxidoreductase [Desulfuromonadales bacterium]|nr:MAG: menaquinol oxidoreductase [Desulfuromonadales bacterium]
MKRALDRPTAPDNAGTPPDRDLVKQETLQRIERLRTKSSRGLWAMALFIAVSIVALNDFSLLPSLPEGIRAALGKPPSSIMISGALVVYTFSAIILILSRMMGGSEEYSGFSHVGYLTAFYGFYHFAKALGDNFWAVFAAGITILGLESYHIWNFCSEAIKREEEILAAIERNNRQ